MRFFRGRYYDPTEQKDPKEERREGVDPQELEKGDRPAMIIAAFAVIGPFFLVLIGVILLLYFFFT